MIFLVEYDRARGRLVQLRGFAGDRRRDAEIARLDLELSLHRANSDREVVLLDAEDEDALRITHRRYFESLGDLIRSAESRP